MTIMNGMQLRKKITREEFDYTLLQSALSNYSGIRQKINQLMRTGVIIRVKKGIYVFGPEYNQAPVSKEVLANLIYGPSCISLEYALAFHGIIPERVEILTSITPKKSKNFETPLGRFSYQHLPLEKYTTGIEQFWIDSNHPVLMASIEKACCDYMFIRKVPPFLRKQEAKDFLENDLRIDRIYWKRFNLKKFNKLNQIYKLQNIDQIIEILKSGENQK